MIKKLLLTALLGITFGAYAQNVGIGTATPDASAQLDIVSTNSGLLIPRVTLTGTNDVATIPSPTTSLLVYNTTPAGAGATAVTAGFYYYNGTAWVKVAITGTGWDLLGNANTNAATNFIGTTDNISFVTKTNNIERMRVTNTGLVAVNSAAPFATDIFSSYSTGVNYAINGYANGTGAGGYFVQTGTGDALQAANGGTSGSAGLFESANSDPTVFAIQYDAGSTGVFSNRGGGNAGYFETITTVSNFATLEVSNSTANNAGILVTSNTVNANAHGLAVSISGAAAKYGITADIATSVTGGGIIITNAGTGRSAEFQNNNAASNAITLLSTNAGTGRAGEFQNNNLTSTAITLFAQNAGLGRVANFQAINAANTDLGLFSNHAGLGNAGVFQNTNAANVTQTGLFLQNANSTTNINASSVFGQSASIRSGVFLSTLSNTNTVALTGQYVGAATGNSDGFGVYGRFVVNAGWGYGVVGQANYFGVYAIGNMGASGTKPFHIDHPLDPENKFLRHYSAESPEVLNFYRGNIVLDANGEAEVQMPDYFNAINTNFSYVLTPVGGPADVYVKSEINSNGKFTIAGGPSGRKISWYVYAERNDEYVKQNPLSKAVEFDKKPHEKGKYLMPELYGKNESDGIFYDKQAQKLNSKLDETPASSKTTDVVIPTSTEKAPKDLKLKGEKFQIKSKN